MICGGYTQKLLRIDLTNQTYAEEIIPEKVIRDYIGGAGVAIKYLYDEVKGSVDPLSPENKLIFSDGPLTGTSAPCASRMAVVAKSPLTGAVGMCMTGGYFPAELKFLGYDMLIIEGKSEKPVYLWIKDGKVTFRSAERVWGTNTIDCQQIIKNDLNDQNIRIACIGPAGENLSRLACIINERRAAGRKGLGAVMGSKNLKAIAIRGTDPVAVADKDAFREATGRMLAAMKESPVLYPEFSKLGTPMVVDATWGLGIFPTKNYQTTGTWSPVEGIGAMANTAQKIGNEHCYRCPVGCSQMKMVRKGRYAGSMSDPEFESMYSLGGTCGVDNLDDVIAADRICDEQGLDTISAGATIAFAMELVEKGILTKEEVGMDLTFGNGKAMIDMLVQMAHREGFGDVLSDGSRFAAQRIGQDTEKYTMQVKGLELAGYDIRGAKAHGLGMATAYTGADHNRSYAFQEVFGIPVPNAVDRFATNGKGVLAKWNQDLRSATCDCTTMCAFLMDMAVPAICAQNSADMVNSVSGLDFTPEEVAQVGERLNNLTKLFNMQAGLTRKDDKLPHRIMNEPIPGGPSKGHHIPKEELDAMLDEYYDARGWTREGVPTPEKLRSLGLEAEGAVCGII
jgi:aldehyde:ferredoxin oxidoreductase